MAALEPELRIENADELYAELIDAHRGLTREASEALNARLILLLINEVGDLEVVRAALRAAVQAGPCPISPPPATA
jgi:hypothetical protein